MREKNKRKSSEIPGLSYVTWQVTYWWLRKDNTNLWNNICTTFHMTHVSSTQGSSINKLESFLSLSFLGSLFLTPQRRLCQIYIVPHNKDADKLFWTENKIWGLRELKQKFFTGFKRKKKKKTSVDKKITYTLHYKRTSRRQFKII